MRDHTLLMEEPVDSQESDREKQIAMVIEQLAHDLNGEIFLIRGYTELLQARLQDSPDEMALLKKLEARTDALSEVVIDYRGRMIANFLAK